MPYKIEIPQLFVASPLLDDPEFSRTVILVTNNDPSKGSVAFVLTRQMAVMPDYNEVLLNGGPVALGQYFMTVHSRDFENDSSTDVGGMFFVSSMGDVLSSISISSVPQKRAHFTGYAGFAPGELEETIREGIWLPMNFDEKYLFGTTPSSRWEMALSEIGMVSSKSYMSNIVHVDFSNKEVS